MLQATLTNDLGKIGPGRAQYTHLLDDADGSVLDDIIVWWVDDETFDVMPNASNTARVRGAIGGTDVTAERAIVAIQGPTARERLAGGLARGGRGGPLPGHPVLVGRPRRAWPPAPATPARTASNAPSRPTSPRRSGRRCWRSGCSPPGWGPATPCAWRPPCRLHGHELGPGITPLQAGLGWVVSWTKPEGFQGRAALEREKAAGVSRRLAGLATEGRQPPRAGAAVLVGGRARRRGDQRQLLSGARPRDRPGVRTTRPRRRQRRRAGPARPARPRPASCPCRSSKKKG